MSRFVQLFHIWADMANSQVKAEDTIALRGAHVLDFTAHVISAQILAFLCRFFDHQVSVLGEASTTASC
jgi:hypothetical protein